MSDNQIAIRQDDIDYAISQDRWGCAIVRAVQREHPDATHVRADVKSIAFTEFGHRYFYDTPEIAIDKVIKPLDNGEQIEPIIIPLTSPVVKQVVTKTAAQRRNAKEQRRKRLRDTKVAQQNGLSPGRKATVNRYCGE